jgi:hypothetical protein
MYRSNQLVQMYRYSIELEITRLIQAKIASACVTGERDWNIRQGYPIPTPRDILIEAVEAQDCESLADIFRLSALAVADELSLYRIDNEIDLEARALALSQRFEPSLALDVATTFAALYDGIEEGDPPDPTTDPFYVQDSYIG